VAPYCQQLGRCDVRPLGKTKRKHMVWLSQKQVRMSIIQNAQQREIRRLHFQGRVFTQNRRVFTVIQLLRRPKFQKCNGSVFLPSQLARLGYEKKQALTRLYKLPCVET